MEKLRLALLNPDGAVAHLARLLQHGDGWMCAAAAAAPGNPPLGLRQRAPPDLRWLRCDVMPMGRFEAALPMHLQPSAEAGTARPAGRADATQGQVLQPRARTSAVRSQLLGAGRRPRRRSSVTCSFRGYPLHNRCCFSYPNPYLLSHPLPRNWRCLEIGGASKASEIRGFPGFEVAFGMVSLPQCHLHCRAVDPS